MGEIGALGGELMEHRVCDQLDGKFDIPQGGSKPDGYQLEQHLQGTHVQTGDLWPQGHILPEARVVGDLSPSATNPGQAANLAVRQIREDVQQHLVGQLLNGLRVTKIF